MVGQVEIFKVCTFSLLMTLILSSCNNLEDDSGSSSLESTDSLVEYQIDQDRASSVDFNNEMTFMQEGTLDMIDVLFKSDSTNIDQHLENCLFELEINKSKLRKYQKDETKSEFANAMIDLMEFYTTEFNNDFQKVVPILKKAEFSSSDEEFLATYDLDFVKLEEAAFEKVFISQEAYARANNISLDSQE